MYIYAKKLLLHKEIQIINNNKMKLVLSRHGQSQWNKENNK